MKKTNVQVITFSPTRTSYRVARAVADGLQPDCVSTIDLTLAPPVGTLLVDNCIAVVAVPVYAGRVAPLALERLAHVRGDRTPVVLLAVYGNRDYEDALVELHDFLSARGFVPLAAGAFVGEHSYSRPGQGVAEGRPDADDLARAAAFGREVAAKWSALEGLEDGTAFPLKGNRPYREVGTPTPQAPVWHADACSLCGTCIDVCPSGAARQEGEAMTFDASCCIKCCACVKACPAGALTFDTPYTAMLHAKFSARREPEVFL